MSDETYGLICSFDGLFKDDPTGRIDGAFVLGVEFGRVTAALEGRAEHEATIHAENQEVFRRWAEALSYDLEMRSTEPPTEGWAVAKFRRLPPRRRFSVVRP